MIQATRGQSTPPRTRNAPRAAEAPKQEVKDWTVLLYLDGDNDAEERITRALPLLERKVGSTDRVNIVAQLGRLPQDKLKKIYENKGYHYEPSKIDGDWSGIRRYYVTKQEEQASTDGSTAIGSQCVETLAPQVHMADGTTLADFLIDSFEKYPAKRYMICFADHGGSILGAMTSDGTPTGHDIMNPSQIERALQLAEKATGVKPDVIDMAACLMASGEVASQLSDRAHYYLASQEVTSKTYQHYGNVLKDLVQASEEGKPMSGRDLGLRILHEYDDKPHVAPDKSLIDLEKMGQVKESVTQLVGALKKTKIPALRLAQAMDSAQHFGLHSDPITSFSAQTRDLLGMAEKLQSLARSEKDRSLVQACKAVVEAVDNAVVDNHSHDYERQQVVAQGLSSDGKETTTTVVHYHGHYDAHGISLFAPLNSLNVDDKKFGAFVSDRYNYLNFPKDTGWGEWLLDFNKQLSGERAKAAEAAKKDAPDFNPENPTL